MKAIALLFVVAALMQGTVHGATWDIPVLQPSPVPLDAIELSLSSGAPVALNGMFNYDGCSTTLRDLLLPLISALNLGLVTGPLIDLIPEGTLTSFLVPGPSSDPIPNWTMVLIYTPEMVGGNSLAYATEVVVGNVGIVLDQMCYFAMDNPAMLVPSPPQPNLP